MELQIYNTMNVHLKSNLVKWLSISLVTLLALLVRIQYIEKTDFYWGLQGDANGYVRYAGNLLEYGVFSMEKDESSAPIPDAFRTPGYPAYIAIVAYLNSIPAKSVFAPLIHNVTSPAVDLVFWPLVYSQAVLGALTAGLTVLLGHLFLRFGWAACAGVLVALSPHLVAIGANVLSETLFTFILLLSMYLFALAYQRNKKTLWIVSGVSFSISYLINPVIFFAPILLSLFTILFNFKFNSGASRNISRGVIIFLVSFFLVVGCWSVRNTINLPSDSQASSDRLLMNLIQGSYSNFHSVWRNNPRDVNNPASLESKQVDGAMNVFMDRFFHRVTNDPVHYAQWYFIQKPLLLWDWNILVGQGDIYVYAVAKTLYDKSLAAIVSYSFMKSSHNWFNGFALLGIVFVIKNRKKETVFCPVIFYIVLLYVSAIYVVTQSEPRYSFPLRPEMYLCAVFFMSSIWKIMNPYFAKQKKNSGED